MRKYCVREKQLIKRFEQIYMFSVPMNARKVVFGMLFFFQHAYFASAEQLDRFYSCSVFKSLSIIGLCLVSMNIPAIKLGALQMDLKKHNWIFLENIVNDFDQF